MTRRLILARHGNTFDPGDKPVWVGARSDLPLVDKGIVQAHMLADALRQSNVVPDWIIAGPLLRTRQTAEIVAEELGIAADKIHIDPRLREIDYGAWEGLSSEEIIAAGFESELSAWNKHSAFPTSPGWAPREARLIAGAAAIMKRASGTSLIISSNGILRFFARAAANAGEFPDRKVATGHICVMENADGAWRISLWNQPPHFIDMKEK